MSDSLEKALSRRIPKVSEVFTGMIDKAEPGSEVKMIENEDFFLTNLLKDPGFVESVRKAGERGVEIKVLLNPTKHVPYLKRTSEQNLFNHLCGAYAYRGIENVKKYLMLSSTKDDRSLTEEEAYDIAKSFEKDVLGKRKYLLRARGITYKFLGKYETISMK